MLVDGKWMANWHPVQATDAKGGFVRQTSSFRNWVTPDGAAGPTGRGGFKAEGGRYHLYAALMRPWAHRARLDRAKADSGSTSGEPSRSVEPHITDQGCALRRLSGRQPGHAELAPPICTSSTRRPIRTSPAAPPSRCCGTSRRAPSSTTSPLTSCGCSIPASARWPSGPIDLYPQRCGRDRRPATHASIPASTTASIARLRDDPGGL